MIGLSRIALLGALLVPAPHPSPAGRVEERTLENRRIWVYTPPGYEPKATAPYDLLIVFDGREYLEDVALPRILDALLAEKKAPAFVAVMVENFTGAQRLADLGNREYFAEYLSGDLIAYVRDNWNVTRDPHRTIVAGSSAGGLAAAFVAFRHPELFGNVLSQSGAFWRGREASNDPPYEWLTAQYAASPRKDIRFLLEVGERESGGALGGAAPSILEANRRLRDALREKGYRVAYAEVPNGTHSVETWTERLPAAIVELTQVLSGLLPGPTDVRGEVSLRHSPSIDQPTRRKP
jgi:enterochelin esterase family protein